MKCNKCIFAMEHAKDLCKCINPSSDENGSILFEKYDGCSEGKSSTFGINLLQRLSLMQYEKEKK